MEKLLAPRNQPRKFAFVSFLKSIPQAYPRVFFPDILLTIVHHKAFYEKTPPMCTFLLFLKQTKFPSSD